MGDRSPRHAAEDLLCTACQHHGPLQLHSGMHLTHTILITQNVFVVRQHVTLVCFTFTAAVC